MTGFNYDDFVADNLPGQTQVLLNSQAVRQLATEKLKFQEVSCIYLTGKVLNNKIFHQWFVVGRADNQGIAIFVPVCIPENEQEAKVYLNKHMQVAINKEIEAFVYSDEDYLTIADKYACQVHIDEDENIVIKRIKIWASQKMVQEFISLLFDCDASATLVINESQIGDSKFNDIGWLIYANETEMFFPIDGVQYGFEQYARSLGTKELDIGSCFGLNQQKYIIAEDSENGQYIRKI